MAAACLTINLDRLVENWRFFQNAYSVDAEKPGPANQWRGVAAVVKADAYGLGAGPVASALWDAGCRIYFVAHGFEGAALRKFVPEAEIIVFHGCLKGEENLFRQERLIPVLNCVEAIDRWAVFARESGYSVAVLHVDTGMNRLGLSPGEFSSLCAAPKIFKSLDVRLIMTHLACADEASNPMNENQLTEFNRLMEKLPGSLQDVPRSIANSAGVLLGRGYLSDLARVGIGLYAGPLVGFDGADLKSVVTLEVEVLSVRQVATGETVSYGGDWTAKRASLIATAAIGYADGYMRSVAGKAYVAIAGQRCPVVGRVTMDLIMIDVTDLPEGAVSAGTMVEVLGDTISVTEMAGWAGTISYEVLTSLSHRPLAGINK